MINYECNEHPRIYRSTIFTKDETISVIWIVFQMSFAILGVLFNRVYIT